jgi:hypothetical protein
MRPNFFVAGAPKCGTTALVQYLGSHPQVYFSPMKEPHYFATDIPGLRNVTHEEDYEALFEGAKETHRAIGEGSVFYLYSEEALARILSYEPDARVIVMLRNPVELIPSLHSQYIYSRNEDVTDLGQAWELIEARARGQHIPRLCRDPKLLRYDRVARLGEQLERLIALFSPERVMWIFFDDFIRDTRQEYLRTLRFLGLDDDEKQAFPAVNQNKRHRLGALGDFTQRPPRPLVNAGLRVKEALGIQRLGLLNRLRRINRIGGRRPALAPEVRHTILEAYRDDIRHLSRLTGRSLDRWLGECERPAIESETAARAVK